MIHQCLLVAWIILAVTWFVWETWLRDAAEEEVSLQGADIEPHQSSPISHQQVTYLLTLLTLIAFSLRLSVIIPLCCIVSVKRAVYSLSEECAFGQCSLVTWLAVM